MYLKKKNLIIFIIDTLITIFIALSITFYTSKYYRRFLACIFILIFICLLRILIGWYLESEEEKYYKKAVGKIHIEQENQLIVERIKLTINKQILKSIEDGNYDDFIKWSEGKDNF